MTSCVQDLSNAHAFRDPVKQDALVCLHVGPLEPAETVELLLSRTGESDQQAATVVAESISHHAASAARLAAQMGSESAWPSAGSWAAAWAERSTRCRQSHTGRALRFC